MSALVRIDAITIGARHRKDMGDIASLAASIEQVGLLHPVVVTPTMALVAGERRLDACKRLGWHEVPVTIVDLAEITRGEFAENAIRKDFLPSEMVAIEETLAETLATPEGRPPKQPKPMTLLAEHKTPENYRSFQRGDTRDKVAAYVGVSGRTLEKAKAVVQAAKAEPEKFGKLVADMDRTGRVDGPYKRLKVIRQAEEIKASPSPLPRGPFPVIVVDPPWPYELRKADPSHRATHPYPQMSIADICAMPIADISTENCTLWLWTTNHHMREAFSVLDAWGFEPKTILTWGKDRMGTGDWLRGQTEHAIMAVRGRPIVTLTNQTTLLRAPMRENSRKPDEFFAFVESLCPAPRGGYVSIFERYKHPGWTLWGDEAPDASAA